MDETSDETSVPSGLVAVGGSLDPRTLLRAYRAGVFPWSSDPVITWWCPDPRAVFELDAFHAGRSLRKSIRRAGWRFSVDQDFTAVMRACAAPSPERPSTWISEEFVASYSELFRQGHAHSVEVWEGEELVGGLYGVAIGGFFGGESMFHRRTDASKIALAHLVARLRAGGYRLCDTQFVTDHLRSLGGVEISREDYERRLADALEHKGNWRAIEGASA
jgi:leucyl/phenylalanyl-tRNA--protein transferase